MKLHDSGVYLVNGVPQAEAPAGVTAAEAKKGTIAYGILKAHNHSGSMDALQMKFDSMTSAILSVYCSLFSRNNSL